MATHVVECAIVSEYDAETQFESKYVEFSPACSSQYPLEVARGDYVQFIVRNRTRFNEPYSFVIYAFDSGLWTDTSNSPTLTSGQSITRQTAPGAAVGSGYTDTLVFDAYGSPSFYTPFFVKIIAATDTVPDSFDVGPNKTGVPPTDLVAGTPFILSGLSNGVVVTATCSANAKFRLNGGNLTSSATVENGDMLQLFVTASSAWNTTVTGTLTIGGVSDSFTVTTMSQMNMTQLIAFPRAAAPISLNEVINFFGGPGISHTPSRNLLSYRKGMNYVPSVSQNSLVPSSAPINLLSFAGSASGLIFSTLPKSQEVSGMYLSSTYTLEVSWGLNYGGGAGFAIGYGPGMRDNVEIRFTVSENSSAPYKTGIVMTSSSGAPGTWSANNTQVTLSKSLGNVDASYAGTLTIQVRSKVNNAVITSATVNYNLNFYRYNAG